MTRSASGTGWWWGEQLRGRVVGSVLPACLFLLPAMLLVVSCSSTPDAAPGATEVVIDSGMGSSLDPAAQSISAGQPGPDGFLTFCDVIAPATISLSTQGLPHSWRAGCVGASGPTSPELPEHVRIDLSPLDPAAASRRATFYIIPTQAYRAQAQAAGYPLVGERLAALEPLVSGGGAFATSGLPVLPLEIGAAANDLAVQPVYRDFGHSRGVRFVGRFGAGGPPLADELYYVYQGFAGANRELLIAFAFPVRTVHLPTALEAVPADEVAEAGSVPAAYLSRKATALNALTPAEWQPTLDTLDALVASLEFGGDAAAPPVTFTAPAAELPPTYAVITAPQGATIMAGPGLCYGVLGLVLPGATLQVIARSADGNWWLTPAPGAPDGRGWLHAAYARGRGVDVVPQAEPPASPQACAAPVSTPAAAMRSRAPVAPVAAAPAARSAYPAPNSLYPAPSVAYPGPGPDVVTTLVEPQIAYFVDRPTISQGECTTLRWSVRDAQAVWVYRQGQAYQIYPAGLDGAELVCPMTTTVYELLVGRNDGLAEVHQLAVSVMPGNELAGTTWTLLAFDSDAALPAGTPPSISFGFGPYLQGYGGCNTFAGDYAAGGNMLSVSLSSRSSVVCDANAAAQEARYLDALAAARGYRLEGGQLLLIGPDGQTALRFSR